MNIKRYALLVGRAVYRLRAEFGGIALTAFISFLAIALYFHHDTDPSFLYYHTSGGVVQNMAGSWGAHMAALWYFLFGGIGSYSILCMLTIMLCVMIRNYYRPYPVQFDRVAAGFVLMVAVPAAAALHQSDLHAVVAGGLLGRAVLSWLTWCFDPLGGQLCIYLMLWSGATIFFRVPFVQIMRALYNSQRFLKPLYQASRVAGTIAIMPVRKVGGYFYGVLSGLPVVQSARTVLDFDYEKEHSNPSHDSFWQEFIAQRSSTNYTPASNEMSSTATPHLSESSKPYAQNVHAQSFNEVHDKANHHMHASQQPSYVLPSLDIFIGVAQEQDDPVLLKELEERARIMQEKLERFGVYGTVTSIKRGPVVTLFEYQPQIDSKISKIIALEDDLALALQALSIRIIAPIPGKSVVGFEIANTKRKMVLFSHLITAKLYQQSKEGLPLLLGEDTAGGEVVVDLVKMPHLLLAGSTGSGKSVALNTMLMSLLCKQTPDQLRLILIDPKRLEFAPYTDIPHLLFPIITDAKKAVQILRWVSQHMEYRYETMAQTGVRNITEYHQQCTRNPELEPMPFIVVVIDELSDLMLLVQKEIEDSITRIVQMARACGIHLIVATQRPSVDVITGLIKVNFPSRISFRVTSKIDSRTILDCTGAEKLLGRGDMLFLDSTTSSLRRVHGAYVSDEEIAQVVAHVKQERAVVYQELPDEYSGDRADMFEGDEQLLREVVDFLHEVDEISISLLQRRFRIGYNRSARIIDMLEAQGLILPALGGKMRKVVK
jgi:DNA segregation ATPase FtsK/SpoIIIE, S-DNA-T family